MSADVIAKLRELYPDEPLLYSFRNYLDVVEAGGFDAARAALERHIEWKAKLAPFHDEIDRLRAEVERMRGKIERQRSVAERLQSERDSARRSADALLEAFGYSPTAWFAVAALAALDAGEPAITSLPTRKAQS